MSDAVQNYAQLLESIPGDVREAPHRQHAMRLYRGHLEKKLREHDVTTITAMTLMHAMSTEVFREVLERKILSDGSVFMLVLRYILPYTEDGEIAECLQMVLVLHPKVFFDLHTILLKLVTQIDMFNAASQTTAHA